MLATKGNGAVATELHKWIMEKKCVPLCFCLCRNAVFSVSKSNPIRFNHHFLVAVFHKVWRLLPLWNGGFNANTNSSNKQCIQVRKATKTKNPKGRETKTWSRISLPKIMIPRPIKRWCELLYIQQDHRNKTLPTKELPKGSRTHAKPSGNRSWIPRCETRFQRLVFVWNSSLISTHRFQVFEVLSPSTWFYLFTTLVVFFNTKSWSTGQVIASCKMSSRVFRYLGHWPLPLLPLRSLWGPPETLSVDPFTTKQKSWLIRVTRYLQEGILQ